MDWVLLLSLTGAFTVHTGFFVRAFPVSYFISCLYLTPLHRGVSTRGSNLQTTSGTEIVNQGLNVDVLTHLVTVLSTAGYELI